MGKVSLLASAITIALFSIKSLAVTDCGLLEIRGLTVQAERENGSKYANTMRVVVDEGACEGVKYAYLKNTQPAYNSTLSMIMSAGRFFLSYTDEIDTSTPSLAESYATGLLYFSNSEDEPTQLTNFSLCGGDLLNSNFKDGKAEFELKVEHGFVEVSEFTVEITGTESYLPDSVRYYDLNEYSEFPLTLSSESKMLDIQLPEGFSKLQSVILDIDFSPENNLESQELISVSAYTPGRPSIAPVFNGSDESTRIRIPIENNIEAFGNGRIKLYVQVQGNVTIEGMSLKIDGTVDPEPFQIALISGSSKVTHIEQPQIINAYLRDPNADEIILKLGLEAQSGLPEAWGSDFEVEAWAILTITESGEAAPIHIPLINLNRHRLNSSIAEIILYSLDRHKLDGEYSFEVYARSVNTGVIKRLSSKFYVMSAIVIDPPIIIEPPVILEPPM